jgi:hypothetical protein
MEVQNAWKILNAHHQKQKHCDYEHITLCSLNVIQFNSPAVICFKLC